MNGTSIIYLCEKAWELVDKYQLRRLGYKMYVRIEVNSDGTEIYPKENFYISYGNEQTGEVISDVTNELSLMALISLEYDLYHYAKALVTRKTASA